MASTANVTLAYSYVVVPALVRYCASCRIALSQSTCACGRPALSESLGYKLVRR